MNTKRYKIYAKRKKDRKWSEWAFARTKEDVIKQTNTIEENGWKYKVYDCETKKKVDIKLWTESDI